MDYYYEDRHHLLEDSMPLSIYRNKDFSYRAHWHQELEIMYVESGSMEISINDHRRKLVAGEFSICTNGDIHYYDTTEEASACLMLVFKPEYFGLDIKWPKGIRFKSPFVTKETVGFNQSEVIHQLLLDIMLEKSVKETEYEAMIHSQIINLCVTLLRNTPAVDNLKKVKDYSSLGLIKDVLGFIEDNYRDQITLKQLAEAFNVDPYNLSKKFNKVTGSNLKSHIHRLRITQAEQMIHHTDKSFTDIALECGFESVRTFNRTFRKVKGVTPTAYKQQISDG